MNKLTTARSVLYEIDALSAEDSVVHRIHPLCKLLVTVLYIVVGLSFDKYDLAGLVVMVLYPALLFQAANIPICTCLRHFRILLPLVCAIGLINPFLDRTPMIQVGTHFITGGMISMTTLMLKGIFSLTASFLLIATTPIDALCTALRKLHIPPMIITLLLLTFRYLGVMIDEAAVMMNAYQLRVPQAKGILITSWGSFLGQLLLRSMDRAEGLYDSMQLRGFHGEFPCANMLSCRLSSIIYVVVCTAMFLIARYVPISSLLGSLFVG